MGNAQQGTSDGKTKLEQTFGKKLWSDDVTIQEFYKVLCSRIFVWHFHTYFDTTEEEQMYPEKEYINEGKK